MKEDTISWRENITMAMQAHHEAWCDVEAHTLTEEQLDVRFDPGFGGEEGIPFTLWTKNHVYFPACYDGSEWVASVARNPDGNPTRHVGGG
jgi:hypothetical protein